MELVVTKWIGMEATALLAEDKKEELGRRFPAALLRTARRLAEQLSVEPEEEIISHMQPAYICRLAEGGIFTGLWTLAQEAGAGLEADLRKIPVKQETVEICEYFDLNPYNLLSGGSLLAAVEQGEAVAVKLRREGIPAVVIGRLTEGNDRILWNRENKRFLDRPQREELEKLGFIRR